MAKFLLVLAVGIVVYLVVSRMRRGADRQRVPPSARPSTKGVPEDMVRCAICGVHLPRSESFTSRGQFYCSDEHRRLGTDKA